MVTVVQNFRLEPYKFNFAENLLNKSSLFFKAAFVKESFYFQSGNVNNAYMICFLASATTFCLDKMFLNFPFVDYSPQQPFQFKILIRRLTGLFIAH